MRHLPTSLIALAAVAALTACGGGGGSGSGSVAPPPPPPAPLSAQGSVKDLGAQRFAGDGAAAGAAIAGATVVVGSTLIVGATPPPSLPAGDAKATTAADGTYTVTGYSTGNPTYVMVFPASGDAHVSLHAQAKVSNGSIRPLYLYVPTSIENAELAQINTDRSANGAGPVIFDEIAMETARAHADFIASTGYYQHCIPASNCYVNTTIPTTPPATYASQYASPNDLYNYLGGAIALPANQNGTENLGWNFPSWASMESWFMAEKGQPDPGHYLNIVNPAHQWLGIGNDQQATPPPGRTGSWSIGVEEFYSAPA